MIEALALYISTSIKKANPEKTASIEVMKFSLIFLINAFLTVTTSLIIGFISDKFYETALTLIGFMLLRYFSGGPHLRSSMSCFLLSTFVMSIIPHIPLTSNWAYILTAIALLLVLIFAPSNIENKAKLPKKYFPLLKLISVLIVASNFFFISDILAKCFFIQSLFLIKLKKGEVT